MSSKNTIDLARIGLAKKRISKYALETPLRPWNYLQKSLNFEAPIFLKLETLQNTGAFKVRGAANKILALMDAGQTPKHVVAASAGNHAQAVAFVAGRLGIPTTIVMPEGSPLVKIAATEDYGAKVVLSGLVYDEAYAKAQEILNKTPGAVYLHAYEDEDIIAGQGTLGIEIHEQLSLMGYKEGPIQAIIPIGGGGLFSGTALALKSLRPGSKFFGVVSHAAPAMAESFAKGEITSPAPGRKRTLAEGLAVKRVSPLTFEIVRSLAQDVSVVSDEEISQAIALIMERGKLVTEGSGAAGVAAALSGKIKGLDPKVPAVFILCGGNIDMNLMSQILERGLFKSGRWLKLFVTVEDKPGELARAASEIASLGGNILEVLHDRLSNPVTVGYTGLNFLLETRGPQHAQQLQKGLTDRGFQVRNSGE
jgi:threonine dehydratase